MTAHIAALLAAATEPPLDPDADTARDWLGQELAKGEYVAAKPTLLDRIINAVLEWLGSLVNDVPGSPVDLTGLVLVALLVVAAIVAAVLFGKPVAARRSAVAARRALFLDDDTRSAAELRAAAEAAAAAQDWSLAVAERFRALARDLSDRTLVAVRPGTTAHEVARRAAQPFPGEAEALELAARDFDDVRYLDREGSEAAWRRTRDLDDRLASMRPAELAALGAPGERDRVSA